MPAAAAPLSDRDLRTLAAVAEATLPAGRVLPGGGAATAERLGLALAAMPPAAARAYRALLAATDAAAISRTGRRLARLPPGRRLSLLEGWRQRGFARRSAVRALVTPLKAVHFDDPALFRSLGCVYDFAAAAAEQEPRYLRERSHDGNALTADEELECDVVVVGSGAGGAVVAKELAERGLAVVVLEEGGFFRRGDFTGRALAMQKRLYRNAGATVAVGNAVIPVPIGKTVGGTTTVNSGTCYRVPDRVARHWRDDLGLRALTDDTLGRCYERVESVLRVERARRAYLGGAARVIARGCDKLGIAAHGPLARNAPDCDGQGVCCFGCPTDAKRSTNVSYVPLALRAGAELFHGVKVREVLGEDGRARGVRAVTAGGHSLTVRARATVLSCGALMTPVLLQENRLLGGSGWLGRNLSIHPAQAVLARFDEDISGFSAIPQGYGIEAFHDEGLLFEGGSAPLDITMAGLPLLGPELIDLAESFDRVAMFGFLIEDESRGRVRAVRGQPAITYRVGRGDVARLQRGVDILARIYFAAGAREVLPMVHGFERLRSAADLGAFRRASLRASDFELTAYHPLGTARMGADPQSSVVDVDHQAHEMPGLYVVDGASVPSSLGVNPQVTIMALATRAAERLAERLG